MKFSCNKDALIKEIGAASKVVSQKNSISIISNVVLIANGESLTIKATDAKVWFETQMPVVVEKEGEIAIYCDKFLNILRALPSGNLIFTTTGEQLEIVPEKKATINVALRYQATDSFPVTTEAPAAAFFRLPQRSFLTMREHTIFSVSTEETRIFVNGVYMEKKEDKLVMVSTDAKRLSYIDSSPENEVANFNGVIIPPKFLNLVKDLAYGEGEIALAIVDKTIYAHFDNVKISSALIDGQFPNYAKVIPQSFGYQLKFNRAEFLETLKLAANMSDNKSQNRIFFTLDENKVVVKSAESKEGEIRQEINTTYTKLDEAAEDLTKAPIIMALNHKFLSEPLLAMDTKEFSVNFSNDSAPIKVSPIYEDEAKAINYFHIIMPMQVD
ncbi:MAG: DNA polymerase III subunit beta [Spirochaetaceae bacterium]|nr:DNA polymerase III subunit beta [Spirochaetaceae bacterium]